MAPDKEQAAAARKYAYEYGRRWNAKTPRNSIKWIVDRYHVATPLDEIQADIRARIALQNSAEFTPAIKRECEQYAAIVHERNGALYRRVMG